MVLDSSFGCNLVRVNSKEFEFPVIDGMDRVLGLNCSTQKIGRKRISISDCLDMFDLANPYRTPSKKRHSPGVESSKTLDLESLPLDILVRILCGVDHGDLKQLFHVSKLIREATLLAKQWHFAFSTPSSRNKIGLNYNFGSDSIEDLSKLDIDSAPNAPKQKKSYKSIVSSKKFADISIALFASPEKERRPRAGF